MTVTTIAPGPDLIGRAVPDHPDHPINFAHLRQGNGMWWYGHQCDGRCVGGYLGWATGCYFGERVAVLAPSPDPLVKT